jgi:hypothetical protein
MPVGIDGLRYCLGQLLSEILLPEFADVFHASVINPASANKARVFKASSSSILFSA